MYQGSPGSMVNGKITTFSGKLQITLGIHSTDAYFPISSRTS